MSSSYAGMRIGYDVVGREVRCFVCKSPLKKSKSKGEGVLEPTSKVSWEELYECENGHIFSSHGLFHLECYEI